MDLRQTPDRGTGHEGVGIDHRTISGDLSAIALGITRVVGHDGPRVRFATAGISEVLGFDDDTARPIPRLRRRREGVVDAMALAINLIRGLDLMEPHFGLPLEDGIARQAQT